MSKNGWSYLPGEILRIVFHCLEDPVMVSTFPIKYLGVPSPSLLQCQLTCKNWSSLAQSEFYKCILLKKTKQLDLLINSDCYAKDLVYYIMFNEITFSTSQDIVVTSFRKIAFYFRQLKGVYSNFIFENAIWRVVKSEWSRGRFSKLQVIPFKSSPGYDDILQYNDMVWGLRNNLRGLEIYDDNSIPTQIMERLSHFPKVDAVNFKFRDFNNVYTIDQQIKKSRSVRFINVTFFASTSNTYHTPAIPTNANAHVSPLIKQLYIRKFLYDCNIYSYVMQVFTNLNKFSLTTKDILDARTVPSLSTEVAIQFLRYLLRIPSLRVSYIPFENLEQVLLEFYDQKRIIKNLDIQYIQSNRTVNRSSYLSVWAYEKHKIHIEVNYAKESPRFALPRIGMIEQNGSNLQYIKMDMGFDIDVLKLWAKRSSSQDENLSSIFNTCPNLQTIYIASTLLRTFGTGLKNKILFVQEIELNNVLLYASFLSDMSRHLPFIGQFEINHCRFDSETEDNVTINMPDTKFTHISYTSSTGMNKVRLKLTTVENNMTRWFVSSNGGYDTCTEKEYQSSLQDKRTLSFFIQCKQIDSINFSIFGLNLIIKATMK